VEKKWKKRLGIVLKIGISGGLITYLVSRSDLKSIGDILLKSNILWLFISYILYIGSQLVSSWRWWILLGRWGRLWFCTRLYFIGCFFNSFMPTGIGGDGVKTFYLYKRGVSLGQGIASVFMDRYIGMAAMLTVGTIGYAIGWEGIRQGILAWVWPLIVVGYVAGSLVVWKVRWGRLARFMSGLYESLMEYRGRGRDVARAYAGGIGVQLLGISGVWFVGSATGLDLGFTYYAVVVPVASVLVMIPLSIGGVGIREGTLVYMLGYYGVEAERALALSLAWFGIVLMGNLIGGVEFVRMGMMEKRREVES